MLLEHGVIVVVCIFFEPQRHRGHKEKKEKEKESMVQIFREGLPVSSK